MISNHFLTFFFFIKIIHKDSYKIIREYYGLWFLFKFNFYYINSNFFYFILKYDFLIQVRNKLVEYQNFIKYFAFLKLFIHHQILIYFYQILANLRKYYSFFFHFTFFKHNYFKINEEQIFCYNLNHLKCLKFIFYF